MWFFLEHGLGPFETPARCVLKSSLTYSPWIWGGTNTQLLRILKSCWQIQADYGPLLAMTLLNHLQQWQAPQQCLDQFCSIDIDIGHTYIYINIYIYICARGEYVYIYFTLYIYVIIYRDSCSEMSQGAEANAASAENATHRIKFGGSLFSDKPLGSSARSWSTHSLVRLTDWVWPLQQRQRHVFRHGR